MTKFNREKIFAEVDKSNQRFETYTDAQRKEFRREAHEVKRASTKNLGYSVNTDHELSG